MLYSILNRYLNSDICLFILSFLPIELIKYYHPHPTKIPSRLSERFTIGGWNRMSDPGDMAAKYGFIDLLEWYYSPTSEYDHHRSDSYIFKTAAEYGRDSIIRWMVSNREIYLMKGSVIDAYYYAAKSGYIEIIETLSSFYEYDKPTLEKIVEGGAEGGHFHMVKYVDECGDKYNLLRLTGFNWNRQSFVDSMAKGGNIEILKWYRDKHRNFFDYVLSKGCIIRSVIESGSVPIAEWLIGSCLKKPIYSITSSLVLSKAACCGHLDILKWAVKKGYSISNAVYELSAKYGHIHILEWLKEKRKFILWKDVLLKVILYSCSKGKGNLGIVMEWIMKEICFEKQLPMVYSHTANKQVVEKMGIHFNPNIVNALGNILFPGSFYENYLYDLIKGALRGCNIELLPWIETKQSFALKPRSYELAGEVKMFEWIKKRLEKEGNVQDITHAAVNTAVNRGRLFPLKWLLENGGVISSQTILLAQDCFHNHIIKFFRKEYPDLFLNTTALKTCLNNTSSMSDVNGVNNNTGYIIYA